MILDNYLNFGGCPLWKLDKLQIAYVLYLLINMMDISNQYMFYESGVHVCISKNILRNYIEMLTYCWFLGNSEFLKIFGLTELLLSPSFSHMPVCVLGQSPWLWLVTEWMKNFNDVHKTKQSKGLWGHSLTLTSNLFKVWPPTM